LSLSLCLVAYLALQVSADSIKKEEYVTPQYNDEKDCVSQSSCGSNSDSFTRPAIIDPSASSDPYPNAVAAHRKNILESLGPHHKTVTKDSPFASIKYIAKDKQCREQGGQCQLTSTCFTTGGRTIEQVASLCGGPVERQCCFASPTSAPPTRQFHVGPLQTLEQHQLQQQAACQASQSTTCAQPTTTCESSTCPQPTTCQSTTCPPPTTTCQSSTCPQPTTCESSTCPPPTTTCQSSTCPQPTTTCQSTSSC